MPRSPAQGSYLTAARAVLARAGQPMHYEHITSIALKLGLLVTTGDNPQIAMSSMLSADIRTNRNSVFTKDRPGVYKLLRPNVEAEQANDVPQQSIDQLINRINSKSGFRDSARIAKKALYLAGRTLDIADDNVVAIYSDTGSGQSIPIHLEELVRNLESAFGDEPRHGYDEPTAQFPKPFERMARRLGLADSRVAIALPLFLLDLALDTVGSDGILVLHSKKETLQLAIKSNRGSRHVA